MIGRFYSCMFCIHGDFQSRSERDFHTVVCKARYLASTTEETEQTIAELSPAQFSALKNGHESEIPDDH